MFHLTCEEGVIRLVFIQEEKVALLCPRAPSLPPSPLPNRVLSPPTPPVCLPSNIQLPLLRMPFASLLHAQVKTVRGPVSASQGWHCCQELNLWHMLLGLQQFLVSGRIRNKCLLFKHMVFGTLLWQPEQTQSFSLSALQRTI